MSFLRRLTDERGVALPVAIAVLFAVAGLATVAARAAIVSNHQSFRDNNAKRAVQAANAGLQTAVYQTNLMQPGSNQCVLKDMSTGALSNGAVQADGWCAPQTEDLGDGGSYAVQVSRTGPGAMINGQNRVPRTVVATGTVNGVRRRATLAVKADLGEPVFPLGFGLFLRDSFTAKNTLNISGGLGSNGNITFGNANRICGPVTWAPGQQFQQGTGNDYCGNIPQQATAPFPFQPVDLALAIPNDNDRITRAVTGSPTTPKDTCSNCNQIDWTPTTRVLKLNSTSVLTLSGDAYLVCRLEIGSSATLQIASRSTPMRIYIDTPENCGGGTGMGSVDIFGDIVNLNSAANTLVLMMAGSATQATSITFTKNVTTPWPMAIYAPNSTIDAKNNLYIKGSLVAKSLTVKNSLTIENDSSLDSLISGSAIRFFERESYKECTNAPTGSAPDSGC